MFEFDKSQQQIQKAVKAFAKGEFDKEEIQELEKRKEYPTKTWKKAAELGFIGIHFPEEVSGADLGIFENVIVTEEMCRKDSSLGITISQAGYASECILRFGNDHLKNKYLPRIVEGEALSGGAFMEPDCGQDLTKISTTATKDGDSWVINGKKTFVLNGGSAEFYIVLCQTSPDSPVTKDGTSLILVESATEGLASKDLGTRLGINMMNMSELTFKNARVPAINLIGEEGKGYDHLQKFFSESRILLAAQAIGTAQGAYERALEYIKGREQFNRPIAAFQSVRHKIADMCVKIESAKLLTYEAAQKFDAGKIDPKFSAMTKIAATNAAMEVTNEAVQLLGGYGYMTEYEIEHFYRDAKVLQIREGNFTILKDIIANTTIGKLK
ncbi:MAG: acyl-CoA dehydrogenase [Desulfobacteraceae bacterium]|nr:MAG: acyl-CoA dehydrogenase [Desulfobacteraceae bacterium]